MHAGRVSGHGVVGVTLWLVEHGVLLCSQTDRHCITAHPPVAWMCVCVCVCACVCLCVCVCVCRVCLIEQLMAALHKLKSVFFVEHMGICCKAVLSNLSLKTNIQF